MIAKDVYESKVPKTFPLAKFQDEISLKRIKCNN